MKIKILLLLFIFSFVSFSVEIKNIIEVQLLANKSSKTYYTIFDTSSNSFIFYDVLY